MTDNKIVTQWGTTARSFAGYTEAEKRRILESAATLVTSISKETGITCYLSYGVLLGAVRNGKLIGHDFDIDVIFVSPSSSETDIFDTSRKIISYLHNHHYKITAESNGQFKAHGKDFSVEFFIAWCQDEKLYQYFAIKGNLDKKFIFPLGKICVEGIEFPAPREPEKHLEAIYGPNWRVPDPGFRYALTYEDWKPFLFLSHKPNRDFWDNYYSSKGKGGVFVEQPSSFASFVSAQIQAGERILDFGCGNGRDGLHFASIGCDVTLCDYSDAAIKYVSSQALERGLSVNASVVNVLNNADVISFSDSQNKSFSSVYARFFLHAINDAGRANFFALSSNVLKSGGSLFLEYRALPEKVDRDAYLKSLKYENGDHFRRLLSESEVRDEIAQHGFVVDFSEVRHGLAVYKNEDPLIGRLRARRL